MEENLLLVQAQAADVLLILQALLPVQNVKPAENLAPEAHLLQTN